MDNKELASKASIFVKYFGSEYTDIDQYGDPVIRKFDLHCNIGAVVEDENSKLILKQIEDISDTEAIEIAWMLNKKEDRRYEVARENNRVDVWFGYNVLHIYHDGSIHCSLIGNWANHEIADYLRSKGYDIDNLIPRGYAVDEKEVKNG